LLPFSAFSFQFSAFSQGSLTPPAAPGAIFKTLQQVEPRIDLQNAPASAVSTSDPNYQYVINAPGSYYLTANVAVTKPNGIKIAWSDVTLDLNGFLVFAPSPGPTTGIDISGGFPSHATIKNGVVWGFSYGIGNDGNTGGCRVHDVVVSACTFRPMIIVGPGAMIENCRIQYNNNAESGLIVGRGSTVRNCIIADNTLSLAGLYADLANSYTAADVIVSNSTAPYGIVAANGSTLTRCVVSGSTCSVAGIYANTGSTLENCSAISNTALHGIFATASALNHCDASANTSSAANSDGIRLVYSSATNCTAYGNNNSGSNTADSGSGFFSNSSQLTGCVAYANRGHGFRGGDDAFVSCISQNNGNGTTVMGFGFSMAAGTTFNNCLASTNTDYGIYAEDSCTVMDCTARGTRGGGVGIRVANRSTISGCTVNDNLFDGIQFISDCLISNNHSVNNGTNTNGGDGIHSFGGDNRIDSNTAQLNKGAGIRATNPSDIVIRNSSQSQSPNYVLSGSQYMGPVDLPASATSAWANF
jgi:hypothetical protein